jgi:hypothetical protein
MTELVDPACVPDTFCEGIGYISKTGDVVRITMFATRDLGDGDVERLPSGWNAVSYTSVAHLTTLEFE